MNFGAHFVRSAIGTTCRIYIYGLLQQGPWVVIVVVVVLKVPDDIPVFDESEAAPLTEAQESADRAHRQPVPDVGEKQPSAAEDALNVHRRTCAKGAM